jgi:uncharacterized protein (TIGR00730 family)
MGVLADAVLEHSGHITGVIPQCLVEQGLLHEGLSELRIVDAMHERKRLMLEVSDAVIVLPGGVGTQDEFWDVLTCAQLGLYAKPCGILNIDGFYDSLLAFIAKAQSEGFILAADRDNLIISDNPAQLISALAEGCSNLAS